MERRTSSLAMVQLRVLGGAVAPVPNDATAYAFRDRQLAVVVIVPYAEPADAAAHAAWADGLLAALRPAASGVYGNPLDDEGPASVREAYPGLTWHRLADVKRRYNPANLFRSNQSIVPADRTGAGAPGGGARSGRGSTRPGDGVPVRRASHGPSAAARSAKVRVSRSSRDSEHRAPSTRNRPR